MSLKHEGGQAQPTIDREEHRSFGGVNAKAVVPYVFDGTSISPMSAGLINGISYDYIAIDTSGTDTDVYTYKLGGVAGITVGTVTITYSSSTKAVQTSVART